MAGYHITHIAKTATPRAGDVSCLLPGLLRFQQCAGVEPELVTRENLEHAPAAVARADLVHVHGVDRAIVRSIAPILRNHRRRYIVSTYAAKMPRSRVRERARWLARWSTFGSQGRFLRRAECLHALTDDEREFMNRRGLNRRIEVLPMGVDRLDSTPGAQAAPRDPDGKRMILFLGSLHPGAALAPFLRACAMVADSFHDLHLVIAGPEQRPWTQLIRGAVRRQGFEDRVTLVVSPDGDQIDDLLQRAVLLVAPFVGTCCPVGALQALARAKPVLISPGCHLPEVHSRQAGWVVRARREEIREALQEALACSDAELRDMGRRGGQIVEQCYSWQRVGPAYIELYGGLLG